MSLSKQTVAMLLDLVEIKISYMDVADREDARDLQALERCRAELKALLCVTEEAAESVVPFARVARRPGRPRAAV
ncbi:MAG TPA: hypothetical protein VLX85_00830 [Stellaceae bacterium]|nr:hypothetical protein [Stellaceae bacterium]